MNDNTGWGFDQAGGYRPRFPEPLSLADMDMIRFCARIIDQWCLDREVELMQVPDHNLTEFEHHVQTQVVLMNTRLMLLRLQDDITHRLGDCPN